MKIHPVGLSYSVWTERWRYMTKPTVPFCNFVNTPKICCGSGTEVGQPAPNGVPRFPCYEYYKRYKKLGLIKSETYYLTPLLSCH